MNNIAYSFTLQDKLKLKERAVYNESTPANQSKTTANLDSHFVDNTVDSFANTANTADSINPLSSIGLSLDSSQQKALDLLNNPNIKLLNIIGAAGTGKTTLVCKWLESIIAKGESVYSIYCGAFTGKATFNLASKMPDYIKPSVKTIHSLLEFKPFNEYDAKKDRVIKQFKPTRDELNPFNETIFIFDEASMIGLDLWFKVVSALPNFKSIKKIILLGDCWQLPAIMDKGLLPCALCNPSFTSVELTTIHRQANAPLVLGKENRIIEQAWRIKEKNVNGFKENSNPSVTLIEVKEKDLLSTAYALVQKWTASQSLPFDTSSDIILTATNLHQSDLNKALATLWNPNERVLIRLNIGAKRFAVGDRVMFTKNDYENGIINGMQGRITAINELYKYNNFIETEINTSTIIDFEAEDESFYHRSASHQLTVEYTSFNGKQQTINISSVGDINGLLLSWAITCHKSQGSEYNNVLVVCPSRSAITNNEWLYTAITRAKKRVIIVTDNLSAVAKRQALEGSTLTEKIISIKKATDSLEDFDLFNRRII